MGIDEKPYLRARVVLYYLVFCGMGVHYMSRVHLNIAILDMVKNSKQSNATYNSEKESNVLLNTTFNEKTNSSNTHAIGKDLIRVKNSDKIIHNSLERLVLDYFNISYEKDGFEWDTYEQNYVFGAFYWLHWTTQIPGGILTHRFGPKIVFGIPTFLGCLICSFMPFAAYFSLRLLVFLKVVQGVVSGFGSPAIACLTARWIPPNERCKFLTAYLGTQVGTSICYPMSGYIIAWSSWEYVFHAVAIFGLVWYIAWHFLVFDTPAEHPRISDAEKEYIESTLGASVLLNNESKIPWVKIMTDIGFWTIVIAEFGNAWGIMITTTYSPSYYKNVHDLDIKQTGIITGVPYVSRIFFAIIFSIFIDYMITANKLSLSNARKLSGGLSNFIQGLFIFGFAFSGYNTVLSVILLIFGVTFNGAFSSGPSANLVDICPNYASVLSGINGVVKSFPGTLSALLVGYLTYSDQSMEQWRKVFIINAFVLIGTGIMYVIFTDAKLRPWNNHPDVVQTQNIKELQYIQCPTTKRNLNTSKSEEHIALMSD